MALIKGWQQITPDLRIFFSAFAVSPYQTGPFGGPLTKRDEGENPFYSKVDIATTLFHISI